MEKRKRGFNLLLAAFRQEAKLFFELRWNAQHVSLTPAGTDEHALTRGGVRDGSVVVDEGGVKGHSIHVKGHWWELDAEWKMMPLAVTHLLEGDNMESAWVHYLGGMITQTLYLNKSTTTAMEKYCEALQPCRVCMTSPLIKQLGSVISIKMYVKPHSEDENVSYYCCSLAATSYSCSNLNPHFKSWFSTKVIKKFTPVHAMKVKL